MGRTFRLVILAFFFCMLAAPERARAQTHFTDCSHRTGEQATLIIPASAIEFDDGVTPDRGELAVFTETGACAGRSAWEGKSVAITAWGDDSMTGSKDGFVPGEMMDVRLWDPSSGVEYSTKGGSLLITLDMSKPYFHPALTYGAGFIYRLSSLTISQVAVGPVVENQ